MPKQTMRIRNKQWYGPESPRFASSINIAKAIILGNKAWRKRKSISENPYRSGKEYDAWKNAYLQAANYNHKPITERAQEGLACHKDSYVVVKKSSVYNSTKSGKKVHIFHDKKPPKIVIPKSPEEINNYLGYIKPGKDGKPKRFFPRTNNPIEDNWKDKVACKSYKEPKEV